jgi:hypothetical protein
MEDVEKLLNEKADKSFVESVIDRINKFEEKAAQA